ncbi:hypothetical protein G6F56_013320 [Rhizopus delemar]|nr:hypothetical protein G6F56_013320 [Rhizopus delemar]
MCYSDFNDIFAAIAALDADVITIENSKSQERLLEVFKTQGYPQEVGPGVFDIHSPRVPGADEMKEKIDGVIKYIPKERVWVNPDCGLKTRGWAETEAALINMVEVAKQLRTLH